MKQVLITREGPVADDVPAPTLEPGTVRVAVVRSCISVGTELSGLKRSELPLWRLALRYPQQVQKALETVATHGVARTWDLVQGQLDAGLPVGYSAAGAVIDAAPDVTEFRPGDRVACAGAQCAHHAEIIRVPRNLVARIPDALGYGEASTVALGAIALQGVRRAQPTLGETFVVIGLGALGLLTVQMLHANGCGVIGVDLDDSRLTLARRLGCSATIRAGGSLDPIARMTGGVGADGVIITAATPSHDVVSSAFKVCRRKGRVVLVGDVGLHLNRADLYAKELDFLVSCSYGPGRYDEQYETSGIDYPVAYVRWTENRNMAEYMRLLETRRVQVEPLIAHTFPVDRSAEAYAALQTPDRPLLVTLSYPQSATADASATVIRSPRVKASRPGRIRVGVIGAGGFAKGVHLPNMRSLDSLCELRAVVSRSGHNAAAVARRFGAAYCSTDYREVLDDRDVDAVIIATRHHLHASMALDALAAGKHVLLEKPLAITQKELDRFDDFFASAPRNRALPILLTGFNRRFSPYAGRVRECLSARTNPVMIDYRMNAGYLARDHWTRGPEGGGRNLGEACHIYDLFTYLVGAKASGVQVASITPATAYYSSNDNFTATITFTDGSMATLAYTALGHKSHPKERFEVFAEGEVIALDDYRSLTLSGAPRRGLRTRLPDKGQRGELDAFLRAIGDGGPWPSEWWEQRQATQIALDVERALNRVS